MYLSRQVRTFISPYVLVRQRGNFFMSNSDKQIYIDTLFSIAKNQNTEIFAYLLENSSVELFLKTENLPKFMQSLNSVFIRKRNKTYEIKPKNELKRYDVKDINISQFEDILAYFVSKNAYTFRDTQKNLSIGQKIEIQQFKKRTYMNIVPLIKNKHKNITYHKEKIPNLAYTEILATEIISCERNFPVVFTNDASPRLIALLGKTSNLIIDDNFKDYIPAYLQNYPFLLAKVDKENILCIDEDAKEFSGDGEKLFGDDGEPSKFLSQAIGAMKNYNAEFEKTITALEEIKKSGILIKKELSVTHENKKYVLIKGFSIVSKKKLLELDDATLANFARKGYLELIHSHLRSLNNLENLTTKILNDENK
ncbi:SapC family protein [Campylobacter sputorum]|uniref:SapC family protein n=1 Tax=Campylobacter sputorum TaxID=206 RepID=UPI000B779D9A|nr:SapC family protein [Campylobacter sputorum subsp. sputorum]